MILASTGASAMLIFVLPHSPVSRPWNIVGGRLVSAFVGGSCLLLIESPRFSSSTAIALVMVSMHLFRCMHPPGGATAVTAAIGSEQIKMLGYALRWFWSFSMQSSFSPLPWESGCCVTGTLFIRKVSWSIQVFNGPDGSLYAGSQLQFFQNVFHVDLDRAIRDSKLTTDHLVTFSVHDQSEDFKLSGG